MHRLTPLRVLGGLGLLLACAGHGPVSEPPLVPEETVEVRPGIEVLLSDSAHLVSGRRVGLVTNQTGIDTAGVSDVDRMLGAGVTLVALFSPEHGFRGAAAPGAAIASTTDSASGLPIYSLYGQTSAPTAAMLNGIDVMAIDLQDVGGRYYTYISTAIEVMRAAERQGIPVLILDRPNPLGGRVQGNVLDSAYSSFVGRLEVPMRHGMTMAEMAALANAELGIGATLLVAPVDGWKRSMTYDETKLPFVAPSPNLQTLESLFHYPGICLFEGTSMSVGRGSEAPFEQIGAPWLDTTRVLDTLRAAGLPGVEFSGVTFTPVNPGDGKYANTALIGIRLKVTDRAVYDPTKTAVHLLAVIHAAHPEELEWNAAHFDRLAGNSSLREGLARGIAPDLLVAGWSEEVFAFGKRAAPHLIYERPEAE